jgi:hypothetical protein
MTTTTTAPTRYRKKPVVIDAIQWTGTNLADMTQFAGTLFDTINPLDRGDNPDNDAQVFDKLHSVWVPLASGDWIIRGVQDELYPCKDDVFRQTYEPVDGPS